MVNHSLSGTWLAGMVHGSVTPEYNKLERVAAWDEIGVEAIAFRLEKTIRRHAVNDTSFSFMIPLSERDLSLFREFGSKVLGRGFHRYSMYVLSCFRFLSKRVTF
jgi:hypothetical protein